MPKEVWSIEPDEKHPLRFKPKDLVDNLDLETELEAYLEWHGETRVLTIRQVSK